MINGKMKMFFALIIGMKMCLIQALHNSMTSLELKHFFGTEQKEKVPQYSLSNPSKKWINDNTFQIELLIEGVLEKFVLRQKPHLFSQDCHVAIDNMKVAQPEQFQCVYEGESLMRNGTHIAISGCNDQFHGMVVTENGEYHLIQAHPSSGKHVIHKRSLNSIEHECLFDATEDPYPEDRDESELRSKMMKLMKHVRRKEQSKTVLTVELAVFADDAMWNHFVRIYGSAAQSNMHTFIMAVVNNIDVLYTQRLIQPRINVKVVRYEILKNIPQIMAKHNHGSGDVDRLLNAFCQYQNDINVPNDDDPKHWDHALLFSGYDLHRNGVKTIAGYAPIKGMCSGVRSCTINEGLDFGSVFVVTHELGHSLGMYHDGDNECDLRCCIMSPSVGSGKTHWSHCSVNEMATYIGHLGETFRPPNCLQDAQNTAQSAIAVSKRSSSPGQFFTLDDQCEVFHGECWKHELKDGQSVQNVCQMVWCGNGEGVIRTAHPALEGTYCGYGMVCRQGSCVASQQMMRVTVGGWSSWNDHPSAACGGKCSPCEINGQIRVMRSIRQCNNPSPNNGGAPCQGDGARGLVCHKDVCHTGVSVENYATRACTKLRNDRAVPNTFLSGIGMQFEQAMCKVWCLISGTTNIRTISNFPDGTPCGRNHYCIKGECRPLLCGATALAASENDCPQNVQSTTTTTVAPAINRLNTNNNNDASINNNNNNNNDDSNNQAESSQAKALSYKEQKKTGFLNQWSGWSVWSECVTYDCHASGWKVRIRRCLAGVCAGSLREKMPCSTPCTDSEKDKFNAPAPQQSFQNQFIAGSLQKNENLPANLVFKKIDDWGTWSACSVSCGVGIKMREKPNCDNLDCAETAECVVSTCTDNESSWTEWSAWSECSVSCGGGHQHRKRSCFSGSCEGNDSNTKKCNEQPCVHPTSRLLVNRSGLWTGWSAWSSCTTKCGTGQKSRRRRCYKGSCLGNDQENERCFGTQC